MKFEDYATHEEGSVREVASFLIQSKAALDAGEMSRSEFDEIAEDLLQIAIVDKYTDVLERKIKIQQAFKTLMIIVKLIP
jgi:hypothetical protein